MLVRRRLPAPIPVSRDPIDLGDAVHRLAERELPATLLDVADDGPDVRVVAAPFYDQDRQWPDLSVDEEVIDERRDDGAAEHESQQEQPGRADVADREHPQNRLFGSR